MIFQISLESGMSLSPKTNTHREFSVSAEGQGHVPLPRVKIVAFLKEVYMKKKYFCTINPKDFLKLNSVARKWFINLSYDILSLKHSKLMVCGGLHYFPACICVMT
jgi:hypothetical protein